jgi:hypothetical protein
MEGKRPGCVAQVEALAQGIAIVRIPNTPEHRPAVAQHLPIRGAGKNIVVLQMKNFAARHLLRQGALHGKSAAASLRLPFHHAGSRSFMTPHQLAAEGLGRLLPTQKLGRQPQVWPQIGIVEGSRH